MSKKTTLLVGHVTEIVGPGHHLKNFLISLPSRETFVVFHPMIGSKLPQTTIERYLNAKNQILLGKYSKYNSFIPQLIFDTLITIKQIIQTPGKIDTYIGLNNFDTLPALFFKGWKIKQIIYYASDYADERFDNFIFNGLYRFIEIIDLKFSDIVSSGSSRAKNRRVELGLDEKKAIVVPNGVDLSLIPKIKKVPDFKFVFIGYISITHGVLDVLKVMKDLVKKYKNVKMAILGVGPAEETVKEFIDKNNLSKNISMLGRLSHEETLKFLKQRCEVGIASYNSTEGWTKYASPLKVKEYLACELGVIISDVPEVAEDIHKYKMGLVYRDFEQLKESMERFCKDPEFTKGCIKNAKQYIKDYDWNKMFNNKLLTYFNK